MQNRVTPRKPVKKPISPGPRQNRVTPKKPVKKPVSPGPTQNRVTPQNSTKENQYLQIKNETESLPRNLYLLDLHKNRVTPKKPVKKPVSPVPETK